VLFSLAAASTIEAGQSFTGLTLTVTNVTDGADEILNFDGSDVTLTNGTNVASTTTNSLNVSVSVAGSTATVSFSGATLNAAQLQTLVDTLTYLNSSDDPTTANRVVTITELVDDGGTANGGDDTAALAIVSTVTVIPVEDLFIMTFDGAFGNPLSYTEVGMTVTSLHGDAHLHLGDNVLFNDLSSTPFRFTLEGKEFDFVGFEVISLSGGGVTHWTTNLMTSESDKIVVNNGGVHHEFETNPLFQGVTWVEWEQQTGQMTIDNFTFADDPPVDLVGTEGNDFIVGQAFAETITGLGGDDTLIGGGGADTFAFTSLDDGIDTIIDFNPLEDNLDFTGLLEAIFNPQTDDINQFVRATSDAGAGDTTVAVDIDGPGDAAGFTDMAILQGVGLGVGIALAIGDHEDTVTSDAAIV